MNIQEFRERMHQDKRPLKRTSDMNIEILKSIFYEEKTLSEKRGCIHISMTRLTLKYDEDILIFNWLVTTEYDAYMCYKYRNIEQGFITPFNKTAYDRDTYIICFVPKRATKEEIEWSTNSVFQ